MTDLVDAHVRTMRVSAEIVSRARVEDLGRPTPCAGWDLRALLAHPFGAPGILDRLVANLGRDPRWTP
jgi:hypothetical protein